MSDAATPEALAIPDLPVTYEIIPGISYQDQLFTREHLANWLGIHPDTLGIWERKALYSDRWQAIGGPLRHIDSDHGHKSD